MKKYIAITTLLAAGSAFADAENFDLSQEFVYGSVVGGSDGAYGGDVSNTATVASGYDYAAFDQADSYSDWGDILSLSNTWYIQEGCNLNVGGFSSNSEGVILTAGGPAETSPFGVIRFEVDSALFKNVAGDVTFSFDVTKTETGGNNNKNHIFNFALYSSNASVSTMTSSAYNSKAGENLLTETQTVSFVIAKDAAAAIADEGGQVGFVFSAKTNNVTGSNVGVLMTNFKFDGVSLIPEPSTFGLLAGLGALALVGTRRRRR